METELKKYIDDELTVLRIYIEELEESVNVLKAIEVNRMENNIYPDNK